MPGPADRGRCWIPVRCFPVSHANAELIDRFYTAFARRDAAGMAACYHADIVFSDPVFPELRGAEAGKMWAMLCERGTDLKLEHRDVSADDRTGKARWDAWYTFSATRRKVHNQIAARFELRDGLIVRHVDDFSFYRWSRQALGPAGLLLGWTPLVKNKVRRQAAKGLAEYKPAPKG
jgi:ketosteroid isomerase-like protein